MSEVALESLRSRAASVGPFQPPSQASVHAHADRVFTADAQTMTEEKRANGR